MKIQNNENPRKKKYEKPLLRVVSIADGVQTLGIGCKTLSSTGPFTTPCSPSAGTPCIQPGS